MPNYSVAASLPPDYRLNLALEALTGNASVSSISERENVSRKFLYQQRSIAETALDNAFAAPDVSSEVLFYIPVTAGWLKQLVICLILICRRSYRGVIEFMQAMLDSRMSLGAVHNLMVETAKQATQLNGAQDLSLVRTALLDEISTLIKISTILYLRYPYECKGVFCSDTIFTNASNS